MSGDNVMAATAWPGFVDILSSVLIMFVFFVMIVASALYFHILIFKAKIISQAQEQMVMQSDTTVVSAQNRVLQQKVQGLTQKMETMEQVISEYEEQFHQEATQFGESTEQDLTVIPEENTIIVFFGNDSITLTAESKTEIENFTTDYLANNAAEFTTIRIQGGKDPEMVGSSTRKIAVARMLNVRNMFLNTDIPPNQIIPRILDGQKVDESFHWVKIIFEQQ